MPHGHPPPPSSPSPHMPHQRLSLSLLPICPSRSPLSSARSPSCAPFPPVLHLPRPSLTIPISPLPCPPLSLLIYPSGAPLLCWPLLPYAPLSSAAVVLAASRCGSQGAMELPVADPGPIRGDASLLQCPYVDSEVVHKLAQLLLPGLATVCVDNTTGDPFNKPSSVAVELRKEMVDYIIQRSETFIADSLIESEENQEQENEMPEDLNEIVAIFIEDFGSMKRNILSHVSGWLLSDSREDKIDDFVQEMEMTRFWSLERRETVAVMLLRNVDMKTKYHCPEKHENEERLIEHKAQCSLRPVSCSNEGCRTKVSVRCINEHDLVCPFKILACEQGCEQHLMRRDMDRHCVTVCSMRIIKCPLGCESSFPDRNLEEHCLEFLQPHLLKVLQVIHKKGFTVGKLKERAQLLEKSDANGKLAKALDARSLTTVVKDLEAKIKDVGLI